MMRDEEFDLTIRPKIQVGKNLLPNYATSENGRIHEQKQAKRGGVLTPDRRFDMFIILPWLYAYSLCAE